MFCSKCGIKALEGAVFCQKCGAKLIQDNGGGREPIPSVGTPIEVGEKSVKEKESILESKPVQGSSLIPKKTLTIPVEPVAVSLSESADTSTTSTEPMSVSRDDQSDFYSSEAFRRNDKNYGSTIKPYYCAQFNRIESGEKTNFNWAAFLWGGGNMLYNGCNKLFCRTFLPVSVVVFLGQVLNALGAAVSNSSLINISLIMTGIGWLCSFILSIINGLKFNAWYYQDVIHNPEKPRNRKGLWIYLISIGAVSIVAGILSTVIPYVFTPANENIYDDYSDEFSYGNLPYEQTENIELSETYKNEDEGFSFMYPSDWDIENIDEVDLGVIALVYDRNVLDANARVFVIKAVDDGVDFPALTKSELEEIISSFGIECKVMDLADTVLDGHPAKKITAVTNSDNGVSRVMIQYQYVLDSYVYTVMCGVEEDRYDTYEPIFNAIIDSYTITAVDSSDEMAVNSIIGEALVQLIMNNTLPDGGIANDLDGKVDGTYDRFAICDIDQDGEKELLINISSGSVAASGLYIYGINSTHTGLEYVWSFGTDVTFYDTGFVKEDWSHNQGLADNFWPYSIYQRTDEGYSEIGGADAWEKTYMEFDFSGNPFPEEIDLDGNGIVYFISGENGIDYDNPVDDAEYREFEKRFFGSADGIYVPWQSLELDEVKASTGIE